MYDLGEFFYSDRNTGLRTNYSAKLQTVYANKQAIKQTLITSKHKIEFTYSDFPCHFKVSRDKPALTDRRWMGKKGKSLDDYRPVHYQLLLLLLFYFIFGVGRLTYAKEIGWR